MRAIKVVKPGGCEIQHVAEPRLRDDYILVKVHAVALNPTDWYATEARPTPALAEQGKGCTVGCDYVGTVVQVGARVTKDFKPGDRIAGFTHGVNSIHKEDGCFAEYCVVKGDVQMKVPDNMSDEDASTLGVGLTTVGQALYQSLGLPLPETVRAGYPLLIYGGSTATGSLAIQFATLSGCQVITTCSPKNFDFVKSLGAVEAFNYEDRDCARNIRNFTNGELRYVLDCISDGFSSNISSSAIGPKGGRISCLIESKQTREDVENNCTLAYTMTGEAFRWVNGATILPKPEDFEFAKMFWNLATMLVADDKILAHPTKVIEGGLEGVLQGLDVLRKGQVSAHKLVCHI